MVHFAGKLLRGSGKSQISNPLRSLRSRQRVSFSTQGPLDLFSVERRPDGLVHVGLGEGAASFQPVEYAAKAVGQ